MRTSPDQIKARFRQRFLAARSSLGDAEREALDGRICARILQGIPSEPRQQIAAYFAFRDEPNLNEALCALVRQGHAVFLPVLRGNDMQFCTWRPDARLQANRYGIPEPINGRILDPHALDLILMPLVGYDQTGARLGMGGGYYDRSLAFRRSDQPATTPRLVGIAYSVQEAIGSLLPMEDWDIRLDAVINEHGWRRFKSAR